MAEVAPGELARLGLNTRCLAAVLARNEYERGLERPDTHMRNFWSDTEIRNRETEAMAQHLADRIHVFAFVLTAIVLGMRLIAGRQDLTSDALGADAADVTPAADVQTPVLY